MPILRLRRYRASSSYLPIGLTSSPYISFVGTSASSSYLPEQLHHRRNWEFHRYCARSSYLAIALVNIRAMALRGHRALSGFLPGYVPLERSICFAGTALLAVTYLELISAGVREGFVGTALRAVTYPSRWARFSPASFIGITFLALASRCQENQKVLVGPRKRHVKHRHTQL